MSNLLVCVALSRGLRETDWARRKSPDSLCADFDFILVILQARIWLVVQTDFGWKTGHEFFYFLFYFLHCRSARTDSREAFPLKGKLRRSVFYDAPFLNDAVAFPARPHLEKHGAHESSHKGLHRTPP